MPLYNSSLTSLKLINRGKVRDIYEIDSSRLLIVTTDRLSAFDVVLPTAIPDKGKTLTAVSNFWFTKLESIVPNHLTGDTPESVTAAEDHAQVKDRAIVVKRLQPLPIEAIVRGYLVGSGWKEYQRTQSVCGIKLPSGLLEASKLPQPIFTPSTKAEAGAHDENITLQQSAKLLGDALSDKVAAISVALYQAAADYALTKGIIIADTKFEFGLDENQKLYLIDEALTPDSSRFWPAESYQPGTNPPSFDKQYVRDYLETLHWNKKPPAPELPSEVALKTAEKYQQALLALKG